jgi:hypothetical protein
MPDSDDERPAMLAYRKRITAATNRYLDVEWARQLLKLTCSAVAGVGCRWITLPARLP